MRKITIYDYIASRKPDEAVELIQQHGYKFRNTNINTEYLAACLANLVNMEGHEALQGLAKIHPDKELIMSGEQNHSFTGENIIAQQPTEKKPCGCGGKCGGSGCGSSNNQLLTAGVITIGLLLTAAIITKL